jgi:hypothetical protein
LDEAGNLFLAGAERGPLYALGYSFSNLETPASFDTFGDIYDVTGTVVFL